MSPRGLFLPMSRKRIRGAPLPPNPPEDAQYVLSLPLGGKVWFVPYDVGWLVESSLPKYPRVCYCATRAAAEQTVDCLHTGRWAMTNVAETVGKV